MARILTDSLANVGGQAERRLDALRSRFPEPKRNAEPFEQYLARAIPYAQQDEKFARQLAQALRTATSFGG